MCRSIKVLRQSGPPASHQEVDAAAMQFVRKISGMRKPSKANQKAFDRAVLEIAQSSSRLLLALGPAAPCRVPVVEPKSGEMPCPFRTPV
jgi:hypothetical protein